MLRLIVNDHHMLYSELYHALIVNYHMLIANYHMLIVTYITCLIVSYHMLTVNYYMLNNEQSYANS